MNRVIYLSIACDVDPDFNPRQQTIENGSNQNNIWRGISSGISNFHRFFRRSVFFRKQGQLHLSWFLRADRQIYELYNDAAFCYRQSKNIWDDELARGNEIGWHPHLYYWERRIKQWLPYLRRDDDIEILKDCIASLRKYIDVTTVRTGWNYHSNRLMQFFDNEGIIVDASAVPCSMQAGKWFYDWRISPQFPYQPSICDYRRPPANSNELALDIIEMPILVKALHFPFHFMRFCKRNIKTIPILDFSDYESAKWQGQSITKSPSSFYQAIQRALTYSLYKDDIHNDRLFINTYFHCHELLSAKSLNNLICNLDNLSYLAESKGYSLISLTFKDLAPVAKEWIRHLPIVMQSDKLTHFNIYSRVR